MNKHTLLHADNILSFGVHREKGPVFITTKKRFLQPPDMATYNLHKQALIDTGLFKDASIQWAAHYEEAFIKVNPNEA